jgi:hypothetical protein
MTFPDMAGVTNPRIGVLTISFSGGYPSAKTNKPQTRLAEYSSQV